MGRACFGLLCTLLERVVTTLHSQSWDTCSKLRKLTHPSLQVTKYGRHSTRRHPRPRERDGPPGFSHSPPFLGCITTRGLPGGSCLGVGWVLKGVWLGYQANKQTENRACTSMDGLPLPVSGLTAYNRAIFPFPMEVQAQVNMIPLSELEKERHVANQGRQETKAYRFER
ncbi:hypothetical protein HOY82DRAFT_208515 [Tuber indicum]|nr:hypothetical protein HOY82DRAFT_208515 [Tuber indicum]